MTDGLPATALGFNPCEKGIMLRKPRNPNENIITKKVFIRYFILGSYVGFATLFIFIYWFVFSDMGDGHSLISWHQLKNWSE